MLFSVIHMYRCHSTYLDSMIKIIINQNLHKLFLQKKSESKLMIFFLNVVFPVMKKNLDIKFRKREGRIHPAQRDSINSAVILTFTL